MALRSDRVLRKYLRTRFLVTTKSGQTWDGLVVEVDDRIICLADVESVSPSGDRTTAVGQVFIPRADVAYMQRT